MRKLGLGIAALAILGALVSAPVLSVRAETVPEGGPAAALNRLAWSWITAGQIAAAGVDKPRPPLEAVYPNRTEILVPVRDVLEATGWRVEWNPEGFAYAVKDGRRIAVCAAGIRAEEAGEVHTDWGFSRDDQGVYRLIRTVWVLPPGGPPAVLEQKAVGAVTDSSGLVAGRLIDGVLYAPLDRDFLRAAGVSLAALDKAASPWEVTLALPGAPAAVRFDGAPEGADNRGETERR